MMRTTERGLYCEAGDFYVDPWMPVERAVITHAHGDHARWGCRRYLAAREGERVLRTPLGPDARIRVVDFGEPVDVRGVRVSFHPAGHILGSAQVRVEHRGEVWVVSGDYKTEPDPTCTPFESVRCHTFVTESTFGLPIYRWTPDREVFASIDAWWRTNQEAGKASLLYAYALGKAQRLLAGVDPSIGPIYEHGAVARLTAKQRVVPRGELVDELEARVVARAGVLGTRITEPDDQLERLTCHVVSPAPKTPPAACGNIRSGRRALPSAP